MSVLVTNIGINPTTVEPNFSAWTENQNTIGALRPDRNFATWVHLPRLGSARLIGFLANIHRKIGRKTLIWQICCEQDAYCILSTLIFHRIVENAVDYRARISLKVSRCLLLCLPDEVAHNNGGGELGQRLRFRFCYGDCHEAEL